MTINFNSLHDAENFITDATSTITHMFGFTNTTITKTLSIEMIEVTASIENSIFTNITIRVDKNKNLLTILDTNEGTHVLTNDWSFERFPIRGWMIDLQMEQLYSFMHKWAE